MGGSPESSKRRVKIINPNSPTSRANWIQQNVHDGFFEISFPVNMNNFIDVADEPSFDPNVQIKRVIDSESLQMFRLMHISNLCHHQRIQLSNFVHGWVRAQNRSMPGQQKISPLLKIIGFEKSVSNSTLPEDSNAFSDVPPASKNQRPTIQQMIASESNAKLKSGLFPQLPDGGYAVRILIERLPGVSLAECLNNGGCLTEKSISIIALRLLNALEAIVECLGIGTSSFNVNNIFIANYLCPRNSIPYFTDENELQNEDANKCDSVDVFLSPAIQIQHFIGISLHSSARVPPSLTKFYNLRQDSPSKVAGGGNSESLNLLPSGNSVDSTCSHCWNTSRSHALLDAQDLLTVAKRSLVLSALVDRCISTSKLDYADAQKAMIACDLTDLADVLASCANGKVSMGSLVDAFKNENDALNRGAASCVMLSPFIETFLQDLEISDHLRNTDGTPKDENEGKNGIQDRISRMLIDNQLIGLSKEEVDQAMIRLAQEQSRSNEKKIITHGRKLRAFQMLNSMPPVVSLMYKHSQTPLFVKFWECLHSSLLFDVLLSSRWSSTPRTREDCTNGQLNTAVDVEIIDIGALKTHEFIIRSLPPPRQPIDIKKKKRSLRLPPLNDSIDKAESNSQIELPEKTRSAVHNKPTVDYSDILRKVVFLSKKLKSVRSQKPSNQSLQMYFNGLIDIIPNFARFVSVSPSCTPGGLSTSLAVDELELKASSHFVVDDAKTTDLNLDEAMKNEYASIHTESQTLIGNSLLLLKDIEFALPWLSTEDVVNGILGKKKQFFDEIPPKLDTDKERDTAFGKSFSQHTETPQLEEEENQVLQNALYNNDAHQMNMKQNDAKIKNSMLVTNFMMKKKITSFASKPNSEPIQINEDDGYKLGNNADQDNLNKEKNNRIRTNIQTYDATASRRPDSELIYLKDSQIDEDEEDLDQHAIHDHQNKNKEATYGANTENFGNDDLY